MSVRIRVAEPSDFAGIQDAYARFDYKRQIRSDDEHRSVLLSSNLRKRHLPIQLGFGAGPVGAHRADQKRNTAYNPRWEAGLPASEADESASYVAQARSQNRIEGRNAPAGWL